MSRRFAVVLGSLAMLASAITPAASLASGYDAATDMNSMYNTTQYTGAQAWWSAGFTGAGVDVAIIDTGVSPVEGLSDPGKIVHGPDLSFESQSESFRNLDTNGHGTFMAGIIAGRGSGAVSGSYAGDSTNFLGVAPDARILSVKVGVADGGVDVSQVIAAIDWVVQHRNDNGMNIRVLNLSFGTDSHAVVPGRSAGIRGRAGLEGRHLRGDGNRQRWICVQDGHPHQPGLRSEDLCRGRIGLDGHRHPGR